MNPYQTTAYRTIGMANVEKVGEKVEVFFVDEPEILERIAEEFAEFAIHASNMFHQFEYVTLTLPAAMFVDVYKFLNKLELEINEAVFGVDVLLLITSSLATEYFQLGTCVNMLDL
jgi:hypothetical protein